MGEDDDTMILRARVAGLIQKASELDQLRDLRAQVATAEAAYRAAERDEATALHRYAAREIAVAELEAAAANRDDARQRYNELLDALERLLAAGKPV